MSHIPEEVVNKLGSLQNQIWQTVSLTVSESCGQAVTFGSPLVLATPTAELYSEMAAPKLIIQFAFASLPENSQVILVPQESFADLSALFKNEDRVDADEALVSDVRPYFEAIVQGICLAVGNARNEPIVASGLSVRYQIFSFPPNLQRAEELVRVNVAISGEDLAGTALWLMDAETAHAMLGMPIQEDDKPSTAGLPTLAPGAAPGPGPVVSHPDIDTGSLELLMDIPLEISVELGRVKMQVREVVDLGSGSIVEIDKAAGEPVDVLVNGRLVARGEVVVIEDNFGVRLTEILSPQERLARLSEAS